MGKGFTARGTVAAMPAFRQQVSTGGWWGAPWRMQGSLKLLHSED